MKESKKALCVGGPLHGELRGIGGLGGIMRVAGDPGPLSSIRYPSANEEPCVIEFKTGWYRLGALALHTKEIVSMWYWMGWDK